MQSLTIINMPGQTEHGVQLFGTMPQRLKSEMPVFMSGPLHLRQNAFGFTCQYSDNDNDFNTVLSFRKRFIHCLQFTIISLYTREMKGSPLVIGPDLVPGPGTPEEYPENVLNGFSSSEADTIAARPGQVLAWWSETGDNITSPRDSMGRTIVAVNAERDSRYHLGEGWETVGDL